jgi:hypothetical protein
MINRITLGLVLIVLLGSCGNRQQENSGNIIDNNPKKDTAGYNKVADYKFFYALANLPSPLQVINTIYGTSVGYNKDLLNPDGNADKYLTAYKKSVNYGVYGMDLAYIANYGKNQDLLDYYLTTKKLAEELGVQESFDKFSKRFNENQGNKDSLIRLIDMAYAETDKYMKSNERLQSSSQVLAGAFTESIYLALMLLKDSEGCDPCKAVFNSMYEQKLTLQNIVSLFKEFKNDKESAQLLTDLEAFKAVFDKITDPSQMNKGTLNELAAKIAVVRGNMIK